jgi:hypothetical protein
MRKIDNFFNPFVNGKSNPIMEAIIPLSTKTYTKSKYAKFDKYDAVAMGMKDYYDEIEHYEKERAEEIEEIYENDVLNRLDKAPEDLLPVCMEFFQHGVTQKLFGPGYLFDKYVSPTFDQLPSSCDKRHFFLECNLAVLLEQMPKEALEKFATYGTPARYMIDICPTYYQTYVTNMPSAVLDYCDEGITKEVLVRYIIETVAMAWDCSTKRGFKRYKSQFKFWNRVNIHTIMNNPDRLAAWGSYRTASRKNFEVIMHKMIASIVYVNQKICRKGT